MSVDLSGEITAIATAALAVFAIVTAVFAFLAYRRQSQEVDILLQESKREATERRRVQAARVYIGALPGEQASPYAKNASDFPVYNVELWFCPGHRVMDHDDLGRILPGELFAISGIFGPDDALTHTFLTFRDAAGIRWIRMPDGRFTEQTHPTAQKSVLAALGQPPASPQYTGSP